MGDCLYGLLLLIDITGDFIDFFEFGDYMFKN